MRDHGARQPDPLGSAAFSYARWRESFLRLVLRGSCVAGLAAGAFSIVDSIGNGQLFLVGVYAAALAILVVITVFPLPYRLRAAAFLFLLYGVGVSGLIENGMRGDARMFFLAVSVMTALLFDPRAGLAVLGWCLLTIGIFAPWAINGSFHLLSKVTVAGNVNLWIASTVDLIAIGAGILIGLTLFLREFRAAQERVGKMVEDLRQERASLLGSEERYRRIFHRSPVSLWEEDISRLRAEIKALRERGVDDLAGYMEEHPDFVTRAVNLIEVVDVNDSTLHLYGAETRDQLLGALGRTLEPSALAAHRDQILAIAEGRRLHERESTAKTLTGEVLHILMSCSIPEERETYQHMLVNVFDIGERKRAEAARLSLEEELHRAQKMESIGRLAGSVAHDVNNLLAPILGFAQILLEDSVAGDPRRDELEQIAGAAVRARNLTQQLLALGRKQILRLRAVDLRDVLAGFMKILRHSLGDRIRIDTRVPDRLGTVMADTGQIEQVLMNLALNARDAMESGGVLTIALADHEAENRVLLEVSDTGRGMDEETRAHLFEPFYTTKESGKGTGLGLATVYGIVAQHGGTVSVDSQVGAGSTFSIRLPRA
jgi:signal transduction histidine kinase